MVAREQTLQSDVDADHPSHRPCYLRCAIQPLGSSVPALKMQTLASTTQGCNNVCSEVSALAAAVAVAADGIDDGKCALCLSSSSAARSLEPRFCVNSLYVPLLAQHALLFKNVYWME